MSDWEKQRYNPDPPEPFINQVGNFLLGLFRGIGFLIASFFALLFWGVVFGCLVAPVALGLAFIATTVEVLIKRFL